MFKLIGVYWRANRWLTLALLVGAGIAGVLMPAFVLATGALADAVRARGPTMQPLLLLTVLFFVARTLGPLTYECGNALWRQVDEYLTRRLMLAMAAPPGLSHIEDAEVLGKVTQIQGVMMGWTPGQSAVRFGMVLTWRLQGILSLLIVARYQWWAGLLEAALVTGIFQLARWYNNEVTEVAYGRTDRLRRSDYMRSLALSGTAAKETRVFGLRQWLVDQYRAAWLAVMVDIWRRRRQGWVLGLCVGSVAIAVCSGILASVALSAVRGEVTLGVAVATAQALLACGILSMYDDAHLANAHALKSLAKLEELETAVRPAAERPGTLTLSSPAAAGEGRGRERLPARCIRFEDVTFTYPGRREPVLDHLTLEIEAGRSLAIVGENGAGKTTFVKLLARLYEPDSGRITVDGVGLADMAPEDWQRHLAAVFQDFVCFELKAYDNVAFGALQAYDDADAVERSAREAGAMAIVGRLANGWDTMLSRQFSEGTQLSGGEWQRLALARALFGVSSGAGVLVLDEPTASLDVRGEAEVYQRFLELTRGVTAIVISHRFSTVKQADRIVVIEHGRLLEDGSHDELVARGGRYATMYQLQASRFTESSLEGAGESPHPSTGSGQALASPAAAGKGQLTRNA
ncbi:MAG: ABC transporter ATP-binding protein [Chloroflexi bacterium]|nr:ABC transporter ATP-binding protein [Chloroflexota bacterium]